MTSSTCSSGISAKVSRERRGRLAGGHDDDDLRLGRRLPGCLLLRHAAPQRRRSRRDAARPRSRRRPSATGSSTTPAAIASGRAPRPIAAPLAPRAGAAPGRGRGRRAASRRGRRASRSRSARRGLRRCARPRSPRSRGPPAGVVAERWTRWRGRSRCSQRSPNAGACRLSLLGTATAMTPPGLSRRAAWRIASPRLGQVLERVPEDDRRPFAAHRPRSESSRTSAAVGARARARSPRGHGGAGRRAACRRRRRRRAPARAGRSRRAARRAGRGCGARSASPAK